MRVRTLDHAALYLSLGRFHVLAGGVGREGVSHLILTLLGTASQTVLGGDHSNGLYIIIVFIIQLYT